jgi:hypothetical protein
MKENEGHYDKIQTDWYCGKCGVFNFKRRDNCFKCNASREESGSEGFDEISSILTKSKLNIKKREKYISCLFFKNALKINSLLKFDIIFRNYATKLRCTYNRRESSSRAARENS